MPLNPAMAIMTATELLLWALIGFLFWKRGLNRRLPAMRTYLAIKVASAPALLLLLYGQSRHWFNDYCYAIYFFAYWSVYVVSALTLFFVATEIFRSALSGFSGLARFGTVIFRWAAIASLIITASTTAMSHGIYFALPKIAYGIMRSVSILELCLLAFLCLFMNALRLSPRDLPFGIALGFGLMSSSDFLLALLITRYTTLNDPVQYASQAITLIALTIWASYFALPEPVRKPLVIPANSTIYRWNEIASALGHTGTQVAVQQPANSFFLTDVEKVVDKVLTRNLRENESKS